MARGEEDRVKAAERLFDDPVSLEATARFLQEEANHLTAFRMRRPAAPAWAQRSCFSGARAEAAP